MADESGGQPRREAGCGIGARLRDARERAGVTVAQAAQRLHVSVEALEALEAEQFDALGAPIYVKSYLSRYAELLGEPPGPLLENLASTAAIPEPDLTRIPHVTATGGRSGVVLVGVVMTAIVIGVAALVWWSWTRIHGGQAVALSVPQSAPQRPVAHASHPATGNPAPSAAASTARRVADGTSTRRISKALGKAAATTPAAAQRTVQITLQFPASSWASVRDATGQHLYRGMVNAGRTKTFTGSAPLHVVLGYADGVTLRVNGHAAPISPYVGRDHAVSIAVSAAGQVSLAPRHAGG